jgi:hypothetical protein
MRAALSVVASMLLLPEASGWVTSDRPMPAEALAARAALELGAVPASVLDTHSITGAFAKVRIGYQPLGVKILNFVRRIKIHNSTVYMEKVRGQTNGRINSWLHGLSYLLRVRGSLPEVDFILDATDRPNCDAQDERGAFVRAPTFVFSKQPGAGCLLVPDHSIMQPAYFANVSAYSYAALRRLSRGMPFGGRERALWFDISPGTAKRPNNKWFRTRFRKWTIDTPPALEASEPLPVHTALLGKIRGASGGCDHQFFACAEGQGWTMRYKNILLCGSTAVWFRTKEQLERPFLEYWHSFIESGKHIVLITDGKQLSAIPANASSIAAAGEALVSQLLHPRAAVDYLGALLDLYAQRQAGTTHASRPGANFYKVNLPAAVSYPLEAGGYL